MNRPTRVSIWAFGAYVVGAGLGFLVLPEPMITAFGLPDGGPFWPRVVGTIVLILGLYYLGAARDLDASLARNSVALRGVFCGIVTGLILLGVAPPTAAVFVLADLAGLSWTAWALRRG